jgi:medium-chain acyl-[acyl-carrier-protein] hydrolase
MSSAPLPVDRDRWLFVPRPLARPRLRLVCLPYAGGSATLFARWAKAMPAGVELVAVQLPGRGKRIGEAPFTRLDPLLTALAPALAPLDDAPFVLFGHSMGALVAYELTRRLRRQGACLPLELLVSARAAPQLPDEDPPLHALPHAELLHELRRLGGTPESVLADPELLELLLPTLRADFAVIETWQHVDEAPLSTPITVFGGLSDRGVGQRQLEPWRALTDGPFALHMIPGDHFFVLDPEPSLLPLIQRALASATTQRLA